MPKIPSRHCPIDPFCVDQSRFWHVEPYHNSGLLWRLSLGFMKLLLNWIGWWTKNAEKIFRSFQERSLSLKMTPPHDQLCLALWIIRWTIQGQELETASTPPMILLLPSCPESSGGPFGARHFNPSGILFSAAGLVVVVVVFLVVVTFCVVVLVGSKLPQFHFEKSWESFKS